MKKQKQFDMNVKVEEFCDMFNDMSEDAIRSDRLDYCSAQIVTTNRFKILKSYATYIAVFDTKTGIGYDFLRYVYGYTATSAKHISKFFHYYKPNQILTWRPI